MSSEYTWQQWANVALKHLLLGCVLAMDRCKARYKNGQQDKHDITLYATHLNRKRLLASKGLTMERVVSSKTSTESSRDSELINGRTRHAIRTDADTDMWDN